MHLSIIIPHYNLHHSLLTRAIDSVVSQWNEEHALWEIIVVDDGSNQPPATVVNSFHRNNIRLYCQPHRRQGAARNFGLSQAQGQYVLFLDADDYILPNTLAPLLNLALSYKPDILRFKTITTSSPTYRHQPKSSTRLVTISQPVTGEEFMLRHHLPDSPVLFLFRRDLAMSHNIRFPEDVYLEDCLFTAQLHHFATAVCIVDTKVYAYYQRDNSTVNKAEIQHKVMLRQHHLIAIEQLNSFIKDENERNNTKGLQHKHTLLIVDYLRRICRDLSWASIRKEQLPLLRSKGLYPLPLRHYGVKYLLFACIANMPAGLRIIRFLSRCRAL
ncbi:MAG: glycosyltransferase family 2 protein [Bacteroidaceae bacterium]|nr:glycosyltransferase family 2 protein [Bacteroidaceae bacterium]